MAAVVRIWTPLHLILLLVGWWLLFQSSQLTLDAAVALWIFLPVGILGAIIANATGTGGGVVFVPVFAALQGGAIMIAPQFQQLAQLSAIESVAVSFCIQCFGMSVGSLTWANTIFVKKGLPWNETVPMTTLQATTFAPLALGIPTLLLTQFFLVRDIDGDDLITWFKISSLILGLFLLIFTWAQRRAPASARRVHVSKFDLIALLFIGLIGGPVTALFSVGIGEFLAIYLLLRKYPTRVAIASAVWVSIVCVMTGIWFNIGNGFLRPEVALIAIPGAMIGGFLARIIAGWLGSLWLKTLAALWITLSAVYLLVT